MLKALGVIINLGIVGYLGFHAKSCFEPEQLMDVNIIQNPLVLSALAVVALFIAVKS